MNRHKKRAPLSGGTEQQHKVITQDQYTADAVSLQDKEGYLCAS